MDLKTLKTIAKSKYNVSKLLSDGSTNTKTAKNEIKTYILYLAPFNQNNKGINLCPKASKGCAAACLFTAGRGKFSNVKQSRVNKANFYVNDKKLFLTLLANELNKVINKAIKGNYKIAIRLNGTTDLDFLAMLKRNELFDYTNTPNNVIFYDYTKIIGKALKYKNDKKYTVTFSKSENNDKDVQIALDNYINVAAVFSGKLPKTYKNKIVVDGDISDLIMLYNRNTILGLKAKGDAKKDKTGFTINNY